MMIMRLQPTMLKGLTSKHPKWSNNKSMPREIQGTYISIQYIHIHTYSTEQIYHLRRVQASAAESLFLGSTTNRRWTKSCAHICQRCWEIWEIWGTRHASFRGWFFVPCISFVLFVFPTHFPHIMIYSDCILLHHLWSCKHWIASTEWQLNDPTALQFSEALPQMAWQFDVSQLCSFDRLPCQWISMSISVSKKLSAYQNIFIYYVLDYRQINVWKDSKRDSGDRWVSTIINAITSTPCRLQAALPISCKRYSYSLPHSAGPK